MLKEQEQTLKNQGQERERWLNEMHQACIKGDLNVMTEKMKEQPGHTDLWGHVDYDFLYNAASEGHVHVLSFLLKYPWLKAYQNHEQKNEFDKEIDKKKNEEQEKWEALNKALKDDSGQSWGAVDWNFFDSITQYDRNKINEQLKYCVHAACANGHLNALKFLSGQESQKPWIIKEVEESFVEGEKIQKLKPVLIQGIRGILEGAWRYAWAGQRKEIIKWLLGVVYLKDENLKGIISAVDWQNERQVRLYNACGQPSNPSWIEFLIQDDFWSPHHDSWEDQCKKAMIKNNSMSDQNPSRPSEINDNELKIKSVGEKKVCFVELEGIPWGWPHWDSICLKRAIKNDRKENVMFMMTSKSLDPNQKDARGGKGGVGCLKIDYSQTWDDVWISVAQTADESEKKHETLQWMVQEGHLEVERLSKYARDLLMEKTNLQEWLRVMEEKKVLDSALKIESKHVHQESFKPRRL